MIHYPHFIAAFNNATRHLTRLERSVYRDMIDLYYELEAQLPLDVEWLCRKIIARSNEESTAVEQVLNEFFTKTPTGYYNDRCEEEIEKYRNTKTQKAKAGKASADKKAAKKQRAVNGEPTSVEHSLDSCLTPVITNGNDASTNQNQNHLKEAEPPDSGESAEDPRALIFRQGVKILVDQGSKPEQARSFLGKFAKDEAKLASVIGEIMVRPKADATAYIAGAMTPKKREVQI